MDSSSSSSSRSEELVDQISSLSDDLLLHILLSLDMRRAVLTGILSSRWRGLWAHTQSLDFDEYRYYGIDDNDIIPFDDCNGFLNFLEFFTSVPASTSSVSTSISGTSLLDGCPLLEDLVLEESEFFGGGVLRTSSSSTSGLLLKRLTIASNSICVTEEEVGLEIEAPKLQILNLSWFKKSELLGIANLLWCSHDLENLVIKLIPSEFDSLNLESIEDDFDKEYWERLKFPFPCMVSHLMTIKIYGFMGRECVSAVDGVTARRFFEKQDEEIELVKIFLKNAAALKKITIHFCGKPDFVEEAEWLKLLQMIDQKLTALP
ncbi:hypothetical protein AAC387_Pa12g1963 [Persea americana]